MKVFQIGEVCKTRAVGDHNLEYSIEVVSRTEKTLTYIYEGVKRRSKIQTNDEGEFVIPERYSMAPVFRASSEGSPYQNPVCTGRCRVSGHSGLREDVELNLMQKHFDELTAKREQQVETIRSVLDHMTNDERRSFIYDIIKMYQKEGLL